jgi:hypothetical protein
MAMDVKPADFFIGVMEFFAILLPGAILTYLLFPFSAAVVAPVLPIPSEQVERWILFVILAYMLGHSLHHVGSLLDKAYDWVYVSNYKRRDGDDPVLEQVKTQVANQVAYADKLPSKFSWAQSYVRVNSDSAASELERSGADSKFFRSLTLVLLIAAVIAVAQSASWLGVGLFVAALFAFWRFCSRRWVTSQLTYEYFLILTSTESAKQPHDPRDKSNDTGGQVAPPGLPVEGGGQMPELA